MNYIVGTRGSKLSLTQTNWVIDELKKIDSSLTFEIKTISTKGDIDTRPLFAMEQKGIFEKEIDSAVTEKEMVAGPRFELGTHGFSVRCSTN